MQKETGRGILGKSRVADDDPSRSNINEIDGANHDREDVTVINDRVRWDMDQIDIAERLGRIESALAELLRHKTVKEWYTTSEVAELLDRSDYTIREYCRVGRIRAKKKLCGRGKGGEWIISHEELTRLRNEGPLPLHGLD
jgi:hypothetical protein